MAAKIKKTGHTDVFVRLLNGLYKVQVGAYNEKKNAEATVKKLNPRQAHPLRKQWIPSRSRCRWTRAR